jgi:hypothetical protein
MQEIVGLKQLIRNQQVRGSNPRVGSASTEFSFFRLTAKLTGSFTDHIGDINEMVKEAPMKTFALVAMILCALVTGCAGATGNIGAENPIERGLSYIAAAIVTGAILRAIFNE